MSNWDGLTKRRPMTWLKGDSWEQWELRHTMKYHQYVRCRDLHIYMDARIDKIKDGIAYMSNGRYSWRINELGQNVT